MPEIRRIDPADADAVTELWDELGRGVPDGGALAPRGRRTIAAMLVLAAGSPRVACFVAGRSQPTGTAARVGASAKS